MCDQEQRTEEHKEHLSHGHQPETLNCDQCDKVLSTEFISQSWKDTGWNVCDFCIDDLPDFISEYIDKLKLKIAILEGMNS